LVFSPKIGKKITGNCDPNIDPWRLLIHADESDIEQERNLAEDSKVPDTNYGRNHWKGHQQLSGEGIQESIS
jgi:hypothetical protein